ncbi:uncharacterized protein LOC118436178 [Folsomia candida]|nr:uncharacterized protein LOC118436178 [Folsomia candida]
MEDSVTNGKRLVRLVVPKQGYTKDEMAGANAGCSSPDNHCSHNTPQWLSDPYMSDDTFPFPVLNDISDLENAISQKMSPKIGRQSRTKRELSSLSSSHSPLLNMDDYVEKRIAEFVSTLNKWRRQAEEEVANNGTGNGQVESQEVTATTTTESSPLEQNEEAEQLSETSSPSPHVGNDDDDEAAEAVDGDVTKSTTDAPLTQFEIELRGVMKLVDTMENYHVGSREKLKTEKLFSSMFKIAGSVQSSRDRKIVPLQFLKTNEQLLSTAIHTMEPNQLIKIDRNLDLQVLDAVEQCQNSLGRKDGLRFIVDNNKCPPEVTLFIHPTTLKKIPLATIKKELPLDLIYNRDEEDYVLSVAWKVADIAYTSCYVYWMDNNMRTIPFKLFGFVENLFEQKTFQEAMYPANKDGLEKYNGVIPTEKELVDIMVDLDALVAAVHHVSRFKEYFTKPNNKKERNSDKKKNRRKSSIESLKYFEVFNAQAYCLQQLNSNLKPTYHNTYPRIMKIC